MWIKIFHPIYTCFIYVLNIWQSCLNCTNLYKKIHELQFGNNNCVKMCCFLNFGVSISSQLCSPKGSQLHSQHVPPKMFYQLHHTFVPRLLPKVEHITYKRCQEPLNFYFWECPMFQKTCDGPTELTHCGKLKWKLGAPPN